MQSIEPENEQVIKDRIGGQYKMLPAYAEYLLKNNLKEFSQHQLKVSRETDVPLLRYFSKFTEEELVDMSVEGTRKLLTYFSENRIDEFIEVSIKTWVENQLPEIHSNDVVAKDISTISFTRRKVFRDFLPKYSSDMDTCIRIMEEVDHFTVSLEEICYQTLFNMKQAKIFEQHYFLDKINKAFPGIIYVFDLIENKLIYSNPRREEILGFSNDEIKNLGNTVLSGLIHPDDLPRVLEQMKNFESAKDAEMRTIEYRILDKAGAYHWQRSYETVFKRTQDGIPSEIIGVSLNISKEKEATMKLEYREQQLRESQEIAGMGSFEWDLKGNDSIYSPQLLTIFELQEKSNLTAFLQFVHPSDRKKIKESIDHALDNNGLYECEYRYSKHKQEKVIWSRGIVIYHDGKPARLKGTVMDITQRRDMLKRLERSEELHKQAQALTHIGNWTWSILDNKITWSDEMYRIYGLEPQSETITFDRFINFIHTDDREKRKAEIDKALATHYADDYVMRIIHDDGTVKTLQGKGDVLLDENNVPYKLVGTCQDVTKEYLLNKQLKENEETFRQLIANAPEAVILIDEQSQILLWNPKAEEIFGWTAEEVTGKTIVETIIPEMYHDRHVNGIRRFREGGQARVLNRTIEITAMKKNGEEFYIALSIALSTRQGKEVFISFIRDISKEKKAEMELEEQRIELTQKNIELERTNQELMSFSYIASHDLQEPVRKIQTFGNRILEKDTGNLTGEAQDSLHRIISSANRMQRLIQDLLTYSRTSTETKLEALNLNAVLDDVKNSLKVVIDEKHATILSDKLPVIPFIPFQLQQLFENIIGNSIKYSRRDLPPVIRITSRQVSGSMVKNEEAIPGKTYHLLSIADNGIGFDQQYAPKVFELFQRLHNKNEYSGTGIGLAICKKIVQNHNGFITAESTPGAGSVFNIYIPVTNK